MIDLIAQIVAEMVSGTPGAIPEQADYDVAEAVQRDVARLINIHL